MRNIKKIKCLYNGYLITDHQGEFAETDSATLVKDHFVRNILGEIKEMNRNDVLTVEIVITKHSSTDLKVPNPYDIERPL